MKPKKEYRNAIRSRKMICQAYVELMNEKEIEKITVTDIVKKADLNRGTFYAHYYDTHDVLEQIENVFITKLIESIGELEYKNLLKTANIVLKKIQHYLEADLDFFKKLISAQKTSNFLIKIKHVFIDYMLQNEDIPNHLKKQKEFIYQLNYLASGIIGLYHDWFLGNIDGTLNDITEIISLQIIALNDYFKKHFH